jgi:hypothetical protein
MIIGFSGSLGGRYRYGQRAAAFFLQPLASEGWTFALLRTKTPTHGNQRNDKGMTEELAEKVRKHFQWDDTI